MWGAMAVIAVSMVKDEADIIGTVLAHLFAEGVDEIVVADNGSTDGTRELLEVAGVTVIDDPEVGYYQSEKMTALAHIAGARGADWVIPFDADEVWYSPDGTIADTLDTCDADVLPALAYEHVPQVGDPDGPNPVVRTIHRRKDHQRFPSVAFRYHPDVIVEQGNHDVQHPGRRQWGMLEIREFQYRTFEQLCRKVRNGKAAYDATDMPQTEGAHWRRMGAMSDADLMIEWGRMTRPDGLVIDPAPLR